MLVLNGFPDIHKNEWYETTSIKQIWHKTFSWYKNVCLLLLVHRWIIAYSKTIAIRSIDVILVTHKRKVHNVRRVLCLHYIEPLQFKL